MTFNASWVHGSGITVESPENLDRIGHFGWGADMQIRPGKASWFHAALPTPVILDDVRTKLERVFVLFSTTSGDVRSVHVWDGPSRIEVFDGLNIEGEHRGGLDTQNTFNLPNPHEVVFGIGVSFLFQASIGFDSAIPPPRLIVATAGGDYRT